MAKKAMTIAELEDALYDLENEAADYEEVEENLDEAATFLKDVQRTKNVLTADELKAVKQMQADCAKLAASFKRKLKAIGPKLEQAEKARDDARATGCDHKHLKCADCGSAVVTK